MKKHIFSLALFSSINAYGHGVAGNTLISTSAGPTAITHILPGDNVQTFATADEMESLQRVDKEIMDCGEHRIIYLRNSFSESIFASEEQHFYVEGQGWVAARDIEVGDIVVVEHYDRAMIEVKKTYNTKKTTYSFEVPDTHCFFANGYLVHNPLTGGSQNGGRGGDCTGDGCTAGNGGNGGNSTNSGHGSGSGNGNGQGNGGR